MSKAIVGAVEIAGAVALGAVALGTGGLGTAALAAYLNTTQGFSLMVGLAASGISAEAGAIASAISGGRGVNITDRRPASNRQIIFGTQMVGGVLVYESVTGHQYNQVIAVASHSIHSILGVYLDGRKIIFKGSGNGWSVRNGIGFGGDADGNDHIGPDGVTTYNFQPGKVFCEARYGDQAFGDRMTSLTGNDPVWDAHGSDCPSGVGVAYIYLKITKTDQFPNRPEVRILVNGKDDILDPRTGTTGFTNNSALVLADMLKNTTFGLGDSSINQAQLVAAANLCDEQVAVAALGGSNESRYCTDMVFDTGSSVSDVLETMRANMNARISYVGGEHWIIPGAYVAPVLSFDQTVLTGPVQWNPGRSVRDLPNRVVATHISAEYPYSVFGGYYLNHSGVQNNFDLKFQNTSVPYYACDVLHGYPSDQWLNEDGGHVRPLLMDFQAALSVTQCQRLMKQALLSLRAKQGTGTLEMGLAAYSLQPGDTFKMTFPELGWNNEILEVTGTSLRLERGEDDTLSIRYTVSVKQTDASIFAWSTIEELNVYAAAAAPTQIPYTPNAPTNLQLVSDASTAIVNPDGSVTPAIRVSWDTPLDLQAYGVSIQYKPSSASNWWIWPDVTIDQNSALVTGIVAGQSYDVRIRTVRTGGAYSDWLEQDSFAVPVLDTFLGQLGATLPNTQGWIGKWWRSSPPSGGGELTAKPLYTTQSSVINYSLYTSGGADYRGYAAIQTVPAAPDGGDNTYIYARFTGTFVCTATGTYTFGVNSDDGANLIVNNVVLVSRLGTGASSVGDRTYTQSGTINLIAGQKYPVVLEYANLPGSGVIQLLYQSPADVAPLLCDLSFAFRDANQLTYTNGQSVQSLQPAQAGADVTGSNTSNNTNNVGSRPAGDVASTILPGGGVDFLHMGNLNFPQSSTNLLFRGSFEDGSAGLWGWNGSFRLRADVP